MNQTSKFILIVIILAFITLMSGLFFPLITPLSFLAATLIVSATAMLYGRMYGMLAYGIALVTLFLARHNIDLTSTEFYLRIIGFTVASSVLSVISLKVKEAQISYNLQEQQLKIISDSLTEVLITIDEHSVITFVNPSIEPVFGYTPEEVIGKNITMLMPERLRDRHLKGLGRYISTNKKTLKWNAVKATGLRKDGTEFPIEISFGEFTDGRRRSFSAIIRDVSNARNFELKMSELASIVESTDDAIISKDLDGIIKTWNKGAEKMFGWTEKEVIGKSILVIFPEEYTKEEQKIIETLKKGEKIDNYETVRKSKDGKLVNVSLTVSPVKDADGNVTAVSKIARDITYKKRQEQELLKSAERFKAFIENSEEAIWMVEYDPPVDTTAPEEEQMKRFYEDGVIAEANAKMAELYKAQDIESLIGLKVAKVSPVTPESSKFLYKFIRSNYNIKDWQSVNEIDGDVRYGNTSFKGIVEDGKISRAWVVQRETTQDIIRQRELEQGKERYRTFVESSQDAIWRIEFNPPISTELTEDQQRDAFFYNGYIAEANDVTAKILRVDHKSSLINKPLHQVAPRTGADDRFLQAFIDNGYEAQNYESMDTYGDKRYYYSSTMKGIIENGMWVRSWVVRRDITKQKEYEVERERLLAESEKIRTELEVASTEKDRFLANLSHELRTPLVAILGYSSMLMETEPDEETTKKMIRTINKNARLQVQLIEDLLDLSRIIAGKIELKKDFFDVNQIVSDAVETLRQQADEKGIKIESDSVYCPFYGDSKRFYQIVLNLLSNAIKFTEKGTIKICVKATQENLILKVSDTGIGISPKDFDKLFLPFKQLDSSATRARQGLGLGLSIVKNLVTLHGGSVTVESKLGEGSIFKAYFPIVNAGNLPDIDTSVEPTTDLSGIKILLVEDDIDSGGFIKYLYEQRNGVVDWATSAKRARELIKENTEEKYDIYIFDLSMPEEDGISLIRSIRKGGDMTKAVALTAFVDSYYETKALESGFDMFLKKPSSLRDLLSVVKLIK